MRWTAIPKTSWSTTACQLADQVIQHTCVRRRTHKNIASGLWSRVYHHTGPHVLQECTLNSQIVSVNGTRTVATAAASSMRYLLLLEYVSYMLRVGPMLIGMSTAVSDEWLLDLLIL